MFLANCGYAWTMPTKVSDLGGTVYLAAYNTRRRFGKALPDVAHTLFDPQLYLAELDAGDCSTACARLASHGWFMVQGGPDLTSDDGPLEEHKQLKEQITNIWPGVVPEGDDVSLSIRRALEFQRDLGCSQFILPSPLIVNREDEGATQVEWLDQALGVVEEGDFGQPLLATIALSESVLSHDGVFENAGFLDMLVDQITARLGDDALDGAYVVIAQEEARHPYEIPETVSRAYLQLARRLSRGACPTIVVNFADILGLACVGIGATSFATGEFHSLRRLSLAGLRDQTGGKRFPFFYSHRVASDLAIKAELVPIAKAKLLTRVRDRTLASKPLMNALQFNGAAALPPSWVDSQSNDAAAHAHFIKRMLLEEKALTELTPEARVEAMEDWLTGAEANCDFIQKKLSLVLQRSAPVATWSNQIGAILNDEDDDESE